MLKNRAKTIFLTTVFLLTALFPNVSLATPNYQINYQGKLTNSSDVAVANGTYHMKFQIYDAETGGTLLLEENRSTSTGNRVSVTDGLFSILIGSSTSLTSLDFNQTLYLETRVGGTASSSWETLTPRKKLGAVPAAFEAENANTLDDLDSTQFLRSDTTNTDALFTNATTTNATSTNLSISGSSQLGTIISGTWNGSDIGDTYLTKTGDWTGTLDGQEGSYYLDADNLSDFGNPFYTYFNATNTTALSEGSNLYYTDTRVNTLINASSTILNNNTESALESFLSGVTNVFTNNDTIGDANIADTITASNYLSLSNWFATTTAPHLTTLLGLTNASSTLLTVTGNSYLNTISSGTWNGSTIGVGYGGTGLTSYTQGNLIYADSTSSLAGTTTANLKTTLALNSVENTALSTWGGTSNITTVGTIGSGTWNGDALSNTYVDNDLTISGGTIDNSPIGATTPSTAVFSNSTSTNATSTNLSISGSSQLGTIISGTWNGSDIGDTYLTKTGDWTGTLDGQEGSYYLDADNLSDFGNPFYTYFNATNTTALSEGSNLYYTTDRFDGRLSATTTLPNLTTLLGLTNASSTLFSNSGQSWFTGLANLTNATTTQLTVTGDAY
ncbi:hypothetical protein ACFLY7_02200, partial [Patescibacteria group bacterium]